jgi:exosortase A-associated hydrolase 1
VRRLLTFACEGAALGATLDAAAGATGLLFAVGGTQTRIGSHRMFERLAAALAAAGYPAFRFDRRGVGDSGGADPGWRDSGADLAAAAAAFRAEAPGTARIVGLGLCDGAGALCLHGGAAGLDGLILVNPWLVEASENDPAPAALRRHYRERLTTVAGWRKLLSGSVSYTETLKGLVKAGSRTPGDLSRQLADALRSARLPAEWILAEGDATAIAAAHALGKPHWRGLAERRHAISTDSHTFARPGDMAALEAAVLTALRQLEASSGPD